LAKPQTKPDISIVASTTQADISAFIETYKKTLGDVVKSLVNQGDEI